MWPISKATAVAVILVLACAGAGCTASSEDVRPERDQWFFPTGMAMSPDGARLFVANANSDLKYDSGAISVLPVPAVEEVLGPWLTMRAAPGALCDDDADDDREVDHLCCQRDPDFTETLICDEDLFLAATGDAGVRIGNFATDLAIQDLSNGALRVFVPTRGDPSVAWADWSPELDRLSCNKSSEGFDLCDDDHRLSFVFNDSDATALPEEPFGVFADSGGEFVVVTHLTTGSVTLIDSQVRPVRVRDSRFDDAPVVEVQLPVQMTDIQSQVFEIDPTTGLRSATGVAGRTPHAPGDIIYVGSRSEHRVQTFTVGRINRPAPGEVVEIAGGSEAYLESYRKPVLLQGSWFHLDGVGNNTNTNSNANDTRGMTFSPSGDRLYLVNRKPPTLQILDTSLTPTGVPKNQLVGAVDICRQASTVTLVDSGDGERAYVTCFQDGQIYVIDPRGRGQVEDVITVGSGPYAVAAAPGGTRLYVSNFLEDTISVIDLMPGSPTRNRVVLRIGEPRPL